MVGILSKHLTKEQIEIIRTALYFDVFRYPLIKEELFECCALVSNIEAFEQALKELLHSGILKKEQEFILINEQGKEEIAKRLHGNAGASAILPKAYTYSKIIASFPFVEGVCLSGALSKNYYDEHGDIDFFIITKPNRLWICRSLLILRYKLLPRHKKKFWCVNYFISTDNLALPDVNSFTATELAFLKPTVNYSLYEQLLAENQWYKNNFPNKRPADPVTCLNVQHSLLKSFIETIFGGRLGTWLDSFLLDFTLKHWKKKYPELATADFELQFRSQKNVCKRHTKGFQNKVLQRWQEKQEEFELKYNVSLQK